MNIEDDPKRGTGRTTALMLKTIAAAIEHPGEWIEFVDHHPMTPAIASSLRESLIQMSLDIGLVECHCESIGTKVRFGSFPRKEGP